MNDAQLNTLTQVNQFLVGTEAVTFQPVSRDQTYEWIEQTLQRFGYHRLCKGEKSEVVKYMLKVTNYSRQQLVRLIKSHRRTGKCSLRRKPRNTIYKNQSAEVKKSICCYFDGNRRKPHASRSKTFTSRNIQT